MAIEIENTDLVYVPIPKVASTSLKHFLYEVNHGEPYTPGAGGTGKRSEHVHNHDKAFAAVPFADLNKRGLDGKRWLAVVRDPVERLLSAYSNRVHNHGELSEDRIDMDHARALGIGPDPSLSEFILNLPAYVELSQSVAHHVEPQATFIGPDLSIYARLYSMDQVPDLAAYVNEQAGTQVAVQHQQRSAKIDMSELSAQELDAALEFCERDYALLADFLKRPSRETHLSAKPIEQKAPASDTKRKKRKMLAPVAPFDPVARMMPETVQQTADAMPEGPGGIDPSVEYFFVFSPNNSGSTIMAQYLAGQIDGVLPPSGNNEGQNLPEVKEHMKQDRWKPGKVMDWTMIRSVWDKYRAGGVWVDASPPNLIRIDQIREAFEGRARYVASLCSPYQQIASSYYNYGMRWNTALEDIAQQWLRKASAIAAACEKHPDIPFLSYESFCESPIRMNRLLGLGPKRNLSIQGKANTKVTEIRDMSAKTIAFLTSEEIDLINQVLSPYEAALDKLGYHLRSGEDVRRLIDDQPDDAAYGAERRNKWEKKRAAFAR